MDVSAASREVRVRGGDVAFPPKEFELPEAFLRRKDRLTRTFLIEEVWGIDHVGDTKTLDVYVKRIRQKIEEDATNLGTSDGQGARVQVRGVSAPPGRGRRLWDRRRRRWGVAFVLGLTSMACCRHGCRSSSL